MWAGIIIKGWTIGFSVERTVVEEEKEEDYTVYSSAEAAEDVAFRL